MTLDHYISQVHLKQFLCPGEKKLLVAIRKSDLKVFTPRPRDICRVEDGSTNAYLTENRKVEDFLGEIEPAYERCLARVAAGDLDWDVRQVFGGFLAYVHAYTPTALRMFDPTIRAQIERAIKALEADGELKSYDASKPLDWHGKSLSQQIEEGQVTLEIDPKMPQAMVTTQLLKTRHTLASSDVTVLRAAGQGRFLTSDFPSVILSHYQGKFAQRFLPISPKIGLVFHTHTATDKSGGPLHRFVDIGDKKTQAINDEIIKHAGDLVISAYHYTWLHDRVKALRRFRVEVVKNTYGLITHLQERVVEAP